ncbi:hypothetical protein BXY66_3910 [Shimia isoporae]|uniref:Protease inhibitor Inh n=1 Tax=Shimia isoporae TaxID=647720 RepID=A0A4R1N0K6_9RHOB|nr:hypothetical protein [Shimia isoporae]TCK99406.1 hypothetical protein BXY66_3910 [Shimia isoporae]
MKSVVVALSILFVAAEAHAAPKAAKGTAHLCTGFEETLEGVWVDENNQPALRFRFGSNRNGTGCYAWLNANPKWNIEAPGALILDRVRWRGGLRQFKAGVAELVFDTTSGGARLVNLEGDEARGLIDQ